MGKEIEVARLSDKHKTGNSDKSKPAFNGGAEIKPGYGALITGYEEKAANARQEANELSKDAGRQAERENAGKGVDKGIGFGISNNGDGWKIGFASMGDSKLDKYEAAAEREQNARDQIAELKTLANMGVKAEDVKGFMKKALNLAPL